MTGRPYNPRYSGLEYLPDFLDKNIWDVIFYDTTIFDTFYTFQKRKMERNDHKKKIWFCYFFFVKNSTIIFIIINYDLPIQFSSYWPQDYCQENTQENLKNGNQSYQETYENVSQVRPQENTQEIATSPYGGILISRLHLILPSVSPIMITRLCSSLFMALVKSNSYFDRN